jgi:hypothetical protein
VIRQALRPRLEGDRAERGVGGSSRALRAMGVRVVNVKAERVHPECRTEPELKLTVRYERDVNVSEACLRCGRPLAEAPDGSRAA